MISTVVRTCFPAAAKVVADRAEEINKLNVFPVPDGDTGTNMSLTLNTVVGEVQALPADATMDQIAKAITHGSLMGARGNSGVITSQILRGIAEGLVEAKNQEHPTPSDVAHAWWNEIEPTLAPNSLRNYSPAYERAVAQFGPEDVATITSKEVETYINQFAKTHAKKTVITQRQIIRQILNKAQREGYVSFNAAQAVLLPKNLPQKRRHAPPADQIQKIKDNLNDDFGLFAFLIYYTGWRRGEAEGLRYEDIDREKGRIYIRRSVYHTGPTPQIKEPKTAAGIRPVPLLPALAAALPQKEHGYIFSNDGGKSPLPGWFVTDQFDAYRKRTGITVSPHEIRHGYATALYEAGVDFKLAQKFLGHAQLSTTMDIYTDILDTRIDKVAAQMDAAF